MQSRQTSWPILLAAAFLATAMLSCGGFQLRPNPTATPAATATRATAAPAGLPGVPGAAASPSPSPEPAPAPTTAPPPTIGGLVKGGRARITAGGPVNVRSEAGTNAQRIGSLNPGTIVTLREGPVQSGEYNWWQVDNGAGVVGWVAAGPPDAPWLTPEAGAQSAPPQQGEQPSGPKLVDRPVKMGDNVRVTLASTAGLAVRNGAGSGAERVAIATTGTELKIKAGPEQRDGLTWWQVDSDAIRGWAADGDGQNRWLTPLE